MHTHTHTHTSVEIRRRDSSQTLESPSDFRRLQSRVLRVRAQCVHPHTHTRARASALTRTLGRECFPAAWTSPRTLGVPCLLLVQHPRTTRIRYSTFPRLPLPSIALAILSISGFEFGRRVNAKRKSSVSSRSFGCIVGRSAAIYVIGDDNKS